MWEGAPWHRQWKSALVANKELLKKETQGKEIKAMKSNRVCREWYNERERRREEGGRRREEAGGRRREEEAGGGRRREEEGEGRKKRFSVFFFQVMFGLMLKQNLRDCWLGMTGIE